MARKPTPQSLIDEVNRLITSGLTYVQVAQRINKPVTSVKWICQRNHIFKRKGIQAVTNEFCFIPEPELDKRVRDLAASYGIKNSLVCRFASELEIRQFGIRTQKYIDPYNQPPSCQS